MPFGGRDQGKARKGEAKHVRFDDQGNLHISGKFLADLKVRLLSYLSRWVKGE